MDVLVSAVVLIVFMRVESAAEHSLAVASSVGGAYGRSFARLAHVSRYARAENKTG
jgi:hypothetical protein